MTTITTHNPVRADVPAGSAGPAPGARRSRGWALAGVGAGLAGLGTVATSAMVTAVYEEDLQGDVDAITAKLAEQTGGILAFHVVTTVGALLMLVFAAGLMRRLASRMTDSLAPALAAFGLAGTSVVSVVGTGLDTEFYAGLEQGQMQGDPNAAFFNHFLGSMPWCWVLVGLTGLALYAASREQVVPRWIGRTGLVLGGLTVLIGVSPLQYMALATGALLVLVVSVGFVVGDRQHRGEGAAA